MTDKTTKSGKAPEPVKVTDKHPSPSSGFERKSLATTSKGGGQKIWSKASR